MKRYLEFRFSFVAIGHPLLLYPAWGYLTFDQGQSYLAAKHEEPFEQVEV